MNLPSSVPTSVPTQDDSNSSSDESIIVASVSIFLYGVVAIVAGFYYLKFRKVQSVEDEKNPLVATISGKYDHAKQLFFAILATSALLDIPSYLGCLANDGPSNCDFTAADQLFFWFLHLIALCGYAYCIIIPCILWSDMMHKKDGRLFFSEHPYGYLKQYFRILIVLYIINTFIDILCCSIYWRQSDRLHYRSSPSYEVSAFIECVLIVLISFGCLSCGLSLQKYVHEAKLNRKVELRFLFTLNIVLSIIVISLLGRAIFVFRLEPGLSDNVKFRISYTVSTLVARWIPDVFCQLALVYIMRLSASETVSRHRKGKAISRLKKSLFSNKSSDDFTVDRAKETGLSHERVSLWSNQEIMMDLNPRKNLSEELLLNEVIIGGHRELDKTGYFDESSISEEARNDSSSSLFDSEDQSTIFGERLISTED